MPCVQRMTGCRRLCQHRVMVDEYRAARIAAEEARESATGGWATEMREHPPILTFKDWLIQTRKGDQRAEETAA